MDGFYRIFYNIGRGLGGGRFHQGFYNKGRVSVRELFRAFGSSQVRGLGCRGFGAEVG